MPEPSRTPLLARCPGCNRQVAVQPLFTREQAKEALASGADLEVMHTADRDHRWALGDQDRENLRRAMEAGEI
jgi:hypothetical protein